MLEHMMMLVLQLGVIIFAAHSGGLLFKRFRMPSVLGEILAGALIGPYALGSVVLPGLPEGLFPRPGVFPISVGLYGFTTIASVLLLFLVGLKTNLRLFLQYSVPGTVVGVGGALVSFVLGDLAVVLCSNYVFGVRYGFADPVPLFLGVISTATSVSVTARILTDRKKVDSPEGVTILSGAVIDDVLGIILLAIVIGVARSGTIEWARVGGVAFRSVAIWLGCTVLGLAFARQIAGALKKSRDAATMAVLSLGLALIVAGLFEQAGLAMIIGAYIMGLSLSRTDLANVIQDQLSSLYRFFVPIFFCVMGMLVNFQEMGSTRVLVFGLI
ncbi:MAG TPA: cation:proton antiporter, partial [Firmicutes bacterium]|nr:cation:proton antiporter [Bacillota bacterium]